MLRSFFIVLILTSLVSCQYNEEKVSYSFFVAGHTYGNRSVGQKGLHPPFKASFPIIQSYEGISMGFLTGDIVFKCDSSSWDAVDQDLEALGIPVYLTPGNHDVVDRALFESRYSSPITQTTYYSFYFMKDLFIVLDATIDPWNISGDQLDFLEETLHNAKPGGSIYVFMHQLIWWRRDNSFKNIVPNLPEKNIPQNLNYWEVLEPIFRALPNQIFLFAGDLCADKTSDPYFYHQDNNIVYVGSGMGNEIEDNFLFVKVLDDKRTVFEIYALQGDSNRFGKLEKFKLP